MRRTLALALLLATTLTACAAPEGAPQPGASGGPSPSVPPEIRTPPASVGVSPATEIRTPSASVGVSPARLAAIDADLRRRGVDPTGLRVVESESVTWPDGSLGCPQPGFEYTQALVPGARVVVEADGRRYDYRFGRGDSALLCERPG